MEPRMTGRERFLVACRRARTDRAPAWMMRQAGRYLPEYREARGTRPFLDAVRDPALAAELTLQPIRRFGMDAAIVFSDILVPVAAMGVGVEFVEGEGPRLTPAVRTLEDARRLTTDVRERTAFLADTIRRVRAAIGTERALIGFCGGPFTVASYVIEGGSSRNYEHTKRAMLAEPRLWSELCERVTEAAAPYLTMQIDAGADAVQIFESWGGALDRRTWNERVGPYVARLVAAAHARGVPAILYVNGASHLLEAMAESGADVLGIDWRVDPADAIRRVGGRVALQGNLDPCALFAPPDVVERMTREVLEAFGEQQGYVFNLGSGILPKTPVESVEAMFRTVLGAEARADAREGSART
jgi:uroporphyrinogen decarboxylase